MCAKIIHFLRTETVLTAAFVLAVISCFLVPPDAGYAGYIDTDTLMTLFSLMVVMAGFRESGLFDAAAKKLLGRFRSPRGIAFVLISLCFFCSMLITNDVALITFVPLALLVLHMADMTEVLCFTVTLMTIAANLGSMLTPIGNPQNLYLYSRAKFTIAQFLGITLPFAAASGLLLALCILFGYAKKKPGTKAFAADSVLPDGSAGKQNELPLYIALFLLCLLSVLDLIPTAALFIIVLAAAVIKNRSLLAKVDYSLLATFVCFFLFIGNMGRIPAFHSFLLSILEGHTRAIAIGASQIISNVPAALLLSGFTDEWRELIIGTNLGGLGTLIASMASLISYKQVSLHYPQQRGRYLLVFTCWNLAFLAALGAIGVLL